jgi:hypothetical protein
VLLAEKLLEVRGDLVRTANLLDCGLLYYGPTVRCLSPPRALSCQCVKRPRAIGLTSGKVGWRARARE